MRALLIARGVFEGLENVKVCVCVCACVRARAPGYVQGLGAQCNKQVQTDLLVPLDKPLPGISYECALTRSKMQGMKEFSAC